MEVVQDNHEEIINLFKNLNCNINKDVLYIQECLNYDIHLILNLYYHNAPCINKNDLYVPKLSNNSKLVSIFFRIFEDEQTFYKQILEIINQKNLNKYLLEIIPLIDEYIEFIFTEKLNRY